MDAESPRLVGSSEANAAPVVLLVGEALADVGEHAVGQQHQVEVVQHDPSAGQSRADPRCVRGGRVDRHDLLPSPELACLQRDPVPHARCRVIELPRDRRCRRRDRARTCAVIAGVTSTLQTAESFALSSETALAVP